MKERLIGPGKLADLIILNRTITIIDPEENLKAEVFITITGGETEIAYMVEK